MLLLKINTIMDLILIGFGLVVFASLIYATVMSLLEKEHHAAGKLFLFALLIPIPYVFSGLNDFHFKPEISFILLGLTITILLLFIIPIGKRKYNFIIPQSRIDERDTMFSRNELKPGSKNFENYYSRNPEKKEIDNQWREKPGLLKPKSSQFHPIYFASADASFETIEALKDKVDGRVNTIKQKVNTDKITSYLKAWSKKLGAVDVGMTHLEDYHMYSTGGRGDRYGKTYDKQHKYAIAVTVEMDIQMVGSAPSGSIVMESARQYLESGKIAVQMANFIRNIGYEARAHIDGNYEVICPLVARDAGLGEIGRMGLLMTPKLGPRVRIAVVTTNLPLIIDKPLNDFTFIDFCIQCKKCADVCPSHAISFDDRTKIDGVERWQIDQEKCFSLWCSLGTDCGRCVSVCPYAHPNNLMHNIIRAGIKNSSIFRIAARKLDDFLYGRKPKSKKLPKWMKN
jgi:reductive dehalogenase